MRLLGIDEAGRGPVIGPMVIAAVLFEEKDLIKLKDLNVRDSKKISPKLRVELFEKIKTIAKDYKFIKIQPKEIDDALSNEKMNLNLLELLDIIKLISLFDFDEAYVDCPSNNILHFCQQFSQFFSKDCKIEQNKDNCVLTYFDEHLRKMVFSHKADEKFIVVSAASILAKVMRDREIEKIKKQINFDFGSGYPSDPKTKLFLQQQGCDFNFVRKTWQTVKNIKNKTLQDFF